MRRAQLKLSELLPGKVSAVDAHPKRPWIASALENGSVRIYDYATNQVVHTFSLLDLEMVEKSAQTLQLVAEKDPSYKGPRKPEVKVNKKPIGDIGVIKFVDQDIRFGKFRQEKGKADVSWALEDKAMSLFAADWPHLLIVCGENRIFYLDYVSYALKEIDMALLEHKEVTAMEAFALEDYVAFGCTDGAVRLWHVISGAVIKLTTNSTKPIVGMFSHYSEMGSYLTVVSQDGMFSKWRFTTASQTEPAVEIKEGKGNYEVYDMTFDSTEHTLLLLTDKGLISRDYYNNNEINRYKIASSAKQSYVAIDYFPHSKFSAESALVLAKDGKSISLVTLSSGSSVGGLIPGMNSKLSSELEASVFLEMTEFARAEKEKVGKIHLFFVHPINPYLVFVATTNGLSLATVEPFATPHFALLKSDTMGANANQSPNSGPRSLSSKSSSNMLQMQSNNNASKVYFVNESQIWAINSAAANEKGVVVSFPSLFIALPSPGEEVKIAISPSGQYLSVYYERLSKYDIYSIETKKVIDTGSRVLGLVWCLSKEGPKMVKRDGEAPSGSLSARSQQQDVFAFLEGPTSTSHGGTIIIPTNPADSKKKSKGEVVAPATRTITLNVKKVGNATHDMIQTFETSWSSTPKLFTGPLIGLDVKFEPESSHYSHSNGTSFQFYSWSGERIGVPMPTPMDVQWDLSTMKYCLFTFPTHFCVFTIRPRFKLLSKVSDTVLSSLWYNGCLLYASRTDIKCFFASAVDSREVIVSSMPTDAFTSALLSGYQSNLDSFYGCSLVELANDKLVTLTHDYRVIPILIDNPLTQSYILAHAGKFGASVQLANATLPVKYHGPLAKFYESRDRVDAAGRLAIPGPDKLQLYLRHGMLEEAMDVFSSMVKHCKADMSAEHVSVDDELPSGRKTVQTRQMLASVAHRIAQAATVAGNVALVGKVWERLAKIEPTAYRHLALYYAQNGYSGPLQDLYKKLCSEGNRDPAIKDEIKYVAVHISDKVLSDSLLNAPNSYAEYILSLHETPDREAELLETWNARISTEIDPDALLTNISGHSASGSASFTFLQAESKDKAKSGMMW